MNATLAFNFSSADKKGHYPLVLDFDGPDAWPNAQRCYVSLSLQNEMAGRVATIALWRNSPTSVHLVANLRMDPEEWERIAKTYGADEKAIWSWRKRGYASLRITRRKTDIEPGLAAFDLGLASGPDCDDIILWAGLNVGTVRPHKLSAYLQETRQEKEKHGA